LADTRSVLHVKAVHKKNLMLPNQNLTEAARAKLLYKLQRAATGGYTIFPMVKDGAIHCSAFPGAYNILTKDEISEMPQKLIIIWVLQFDLDCGSILINIKNAIFK
jgi:hypothetical protein